MTALDDALWPRATLPRRPMLGAVLDALTSERDHRRHDALPSVLLRTGVTSVNATAEGVTLWKRDEYGWGYEWTTRDPAEAYELLQARGHVPMDYVGRFVCERCGGAGVATPKGMRGRVPCEACDTLGHRPHPPTVAELASWCSLGFAAGDDMAPGILRAAALASAEEFAGPVHLEAPPVWWRVAPPGADASAAYRVGSARRALCEAGLGFRRMSTHTMLYVPPLGLVTP